MSKIHDIAWAAGFLEGEGYIGFKYCYNKIYDRKYPRLTLTIAQVHREPLDAFKSVFNLGNVFGPYGPYQGNRKPHFQYNVGGESVVQIVEATLPYLFAKGNQALTAITQYKEYHG